MSEITRLLKELEKKIPTLPFKPWFPFLLMEMFAEEIGRKTPKPVTKIFGPVEKKTVKDYERLVESLQPGSLTELVVISPTDKFGVTLIQDGQTILNKKFADLKEPTQYMAKIEARLIEEDGAYLGKYLLHIGEFNWTREGMVVVTCSEPVTFDYLFALYSERVV